MRMIHRFAPLLKLVAIAACPAFAQDQTTSSALNGTVIDSTDAVVSGATVTLTGTEIGVTGTFPTSASGSYAFQLLPPSTYTLKIDAPGFKSFVQQGIILTAGQTATQGISLSVGSGSDQVTITSQIPLQSQPAQPVVLLARHRPQQPGRQPLLRRDQVLQLRPRSTHHVTAATAVFIAGFSSIFTGLNARRHLLSPYPQFCGVSEPQAPVGFSIYNALQADYNHRFHAGLNVLVSYTYSKFLDIVSGTNNWAYTGDQGPQNYYHLAAEKSVDGGDTPHSLVANYIYELSVGRGRKLGSHLNRGVDAVVSGLASLRHQLPSSPASRSASQAAVAPSFMGPTFVSTSSAPSTSRRETSMRFNPFAFAQVPSGVYGFGNAPRFISQLRAPGFDNTDIAAQKY